MHKPTQLYFTTSNTWVLIGFLAILMFGVALQLKIDDFKPLGNHFAHHWLDL